MIIIASVERNAQTALQTALLTSSLGPLISQVKGYILLIVFQSKSLKMWIMCPDSLPPC